jgi:ABC-type antimicrobial peptide transport system permease subunit
MNANAVLLDQILTQLTNASRLLMLIGTGLVVLFALVIIILLLVNDRREIAIFRAIGYKRSEIMQIYLTFAALLATIIVVGAVAIGSIAGFTLNLVFYDTISAALRTMFNAPDANVILSVWDWSTVGQVVAIGYGAVLIGSILPIFLNSRTSIISAIRAE